MQIDQFKHEDNWQDIKDAAMNTVNKTTGKYPDSEWKRRLILSEHSPIRRMKFYWRWKGLKSWVSVHMVRHKIGIPHNRSILLPPHLLKLLTIYFVDKLSIYLENPLSCHTRRRTFLGRIPDKCTPLPYNWQALGGKRMLLLCGKTCTGKSTIQKELIKIGMKSVIPYTTRPLRGGEIDGEEYHFITQTEFLEKEAQGFFAETKSYDVARLRLCNFFFDQLPRLACLRTCAATKTLAANINQCLCICFTRMIYQSPLQQIVSINPRHYRSLRCKMKIDLFRHEDNWQDIKDAAMNTVNKKTLNADNHISHFFY